MDTINFINLKDIESSNFVFDIMLDRARILSL